MLTYFEALKRWNLGGTSWCIPRKDTPAYNAIMRMRKDETVKTPRMIIDELEKKIKKKTKKDKKSVEISFA